MYGYFLLHQFKLYKQICNVLFTDLLEHMFNVNWHLIYTGSMHYGAGNKDIAQKPLTET